MLPLLRACIEEDDPNAWREVFLLVEGSAAPAVRRVLRPSGVCEAEIDAAVLGVFEELWLDDCRKLRSCRARSEAGFRAWVRKVAKNSARNWLDRRQRAAAREDRARRKAGATGRPATPPQWGPDEQTIRYRLEEWEPLMAPRDFERLRALIGWSAAEPAVSDRTRRRWREQLLRNYSHLFGRTR